MGEKFSVSLVFAGPQKTKSLNLIYRNKNKIPNILSFNISKNKGEIFITPSVAKKEAKLHSQSYENFLQYLFIHGFIHLTGLDHGEEMEKTELKIRKKFGIEG